MSFPALFTVPPEKPLLSIVARHALMLAGEDPLRLADTLILLPNRRSCLRLNHIFGTLAERQPLLLPRIRPIGEADEMELMMDGFNRHLHWMDRLHAIPPAISTSCRLLAVARHLWESKELLPVNLRSMDQAARLAGEMIHCIDELDREQVDYQTLLELPSDIYAQHWQQSMELLVHILRWWPDYAAKQGMITALARRNALLNLQSGFWSEMAPDYPIIAAGSTGTHPATARLLGVISRLPHGQVILPALDQSMDQQVWDAIGATHPFYQLKRLLTGFGVSHRDVRLLDDPAVEPVDKDAAARAKLLWEVGLPAELTDRWHREALVGKELITRIDCAHEREEAEVAALLLREAVQTEGKTAALITHDEGLIRRVKTLLLQQGVAVDSAVGQNATHAPLIQWMLLIIKAATETDNPLAILAMLKHPCFSNGSAERDAWVEQVEYRVARGLKRRNGWLQHLERLLQEAGGSDLIAVERLFLVLSSFIKMLNGSTNSADQMFRQHLHIAQALADGQAWKETQLQDMLREMGQAMAALGTIDPAHYIILFNHCLERMKWFPKGDRHARVLLLTPIEARLQHADRVVLSGLNEQNWPRRPQEDQWLNPGIRNALGLPDPQASIGLEAHDFILSACSGELFITRSRRAGGAECLPSRWLERLHARMGMGNPIVYQRHYSLHWLHRMRSYEQRDILPSAGANPPLEARPSRLSVTQTEMLLRDPYALYAKLVLRLKPLDPIDESPDAALRGSVLHAILERFVRKVNEDASCLTAESFDECARDVLRHYDDWPIIMLLWRPRIERMAGWFVTLEKERRKTAAHVLPEHKAEASFGPLTVHARVDRVEYDRDGAIIIIDYKTGEMPPQLEIQTGYACQLPLSALLLKGITAGMEYWKIGSGLHGCEFRQVKDPDGELLVFYRDGIERTAQQYLLEGKPYFPTPVPARAPSFNDYAHLARSE